MSQSTLSKDLKRMEIPGKVSIEPGNGDLPMVSIVTDRSEAELYLQGAHVSGFQRLKEPPILFMSQFSRFEVGKPIRGGIPLIFPWFGARDGEAAHGFVRTSDWRLNEVSALPAGGVTLRLGLLETAAAAMWPPFLMDYVVTITDVLKLELITTNTSKDHDFSFEDCLHTYLQVGDVRQVEIQGLQGVTYIDKMEHFAAKVEAAAKLRIVAETDRVYQDTRSTIDVIDPVLKRILRVEKSGSDSTVVWNPWIAKAQQLPDFGNEEYPQMLCIESGNIGKNKITLRPGETHVLTVVLSSHPLP